MSLLKLKSIFQEEAELRTEDFIDRRPLHSNDSRFGFNVPVTGFDFENKTFAIYCSPNEEFFCTDGICTHENIHLEDGLVMDDIIECPMHNGQFNYKTGKAVRSPACEDLKTYEVKVIDDVIYINIDN